MAATIQCPSCKTEFALGEAEAEEFKKELQQKMTSYVKQKEDEYLQKVAQFEKQKQLIEAEATRKVSEEMQSRIKALQEEAQVKTHQLQQLQKKELDLLRDKNELEQKARNIEIEIEKRLLENRKKIEAEAIQRENQLFDLKMKEKDLQLESMKKTIEELKRKSEQGSMQLQGEAQETLLEELLKDCFPYDDIKEVGKGVEGADCILTVRNNFGTDCGKIIFESKRTKSFSNGWIDKLKNDMRSQQADVAILVTQCYPKEMSCFGEKDGVWICSYTEVIALTTAMRHTIIRIAETRKGEENKGEKMQMLYSYLTSNEFRQQMEAIVEGFVSLKTSITKERMQMEKLWKEREKQLERVLISTSGLYGSIKGIAGASIGSIPLLEADDDNLLESS
ncbi:MAG TPA: DUF2130 domain-containing protein [Flavisolibacter sp.]|nr:DUF2130 domain-containing protein [Flavisolibacter sp.]